MIFVKMMFKQRKKGVVITDQRVRLTTEVSTSGLWKFSASQISAQVLQGIRLIKFYAWEAFYAHQIGALRERELRAVRGLAYVPWLVT